MKNQEIRNMIERLQATKILGVFCVICSAFFVATAQSTNQNFPTPVTTNEISGKIPARDIGDARLTRFFYTFDGSQGDVFLNVQTSNFNGDIDIFIAENLKPITKITIFADVSETETGRVIYLRKPEKLILRIEGRTPNDDAATFRIKFAGSFVAARSNPDNEAPETPVVTSENQSDVRVNSVGTIIEVKPKPTPIPKETIAKKETRPKGKKTAKTVETRQPTDEKEVVSDKSAIKNEEETNEESIGDKDISVTVKEENKNQSAENNADNTKITIEKTDEITSETEPKSGNPPAEEGTEAIKATAPKSRTLRETRKPQDLSALENIHLIVLFKDGTKIERPMSEVLRFNVDKGILTIITKDGKIGRYFILDVEKITVE